MILWIPLSNGLSLYFNSEVSGMFYCVKKAQYNDLVIHLKKMIETADGVLIPDEP